MTIKITYEIRKEIERLMSSCSSYRQISKILNIPYSTLSNELNRNSINQKYDAESAQELATIRMKQKYIRRRDHPDTALSLFIDLKNQIEIIQSHLEIIMEHLKL